MDIAVLCQQLRWNRGRVRRWISNKRAYPNRAGRPQKQFATDSQRAFLQDVFETHGSSFDGCAKINREVFRHLSAQLGWSTDRLVRWFRNQRNYQNRKPNLQARK